MDKRQATTGLSAVLKWATVAVAVFSMPELQAALGGHAAIAATGFAVASALKDTVKTVLDHLKANPKGVRTP